MGACWWLDCPHPHPDHSPGPRPYPNPDLYPNPTSTLPQHYPSPGASWKHIEKRCLDAGISVKKPSRFDAVQFAVEYNPTTL